LRHPCLHLTKLWANALVVVLPLPVSYMLASFFFNGKYNIIKAKMQFWPLSFTKCSILAPRFQMLNFGPPCLQNAWFWPPTFKCSILTPEVYPLLHFVVLLKDKPNSKYSFVEF
jgi:hypothetical protein